MRVQRVLMPDGSESWTVLDASGEPVPAVEGFLAHLQALDRSPTTVRTYATSLKLWLQFLDRLGVAVDEATVEHVSRFVAWLRAPAENVTVLAGGTGRCGPATVNKHLAALFTFYDYRARNGVVLAQSLVAWRRVNRGGYRPFLHHVTAGRPVATRPLRLRQSRRLPRTLTEEQVLTLVEACEHLRDRFLLVLLAETGMRVGQALGLRHADFVSHRRELRIVPRRDNANGARAKTFDEHTIPISAGLVRLYTAYMFDEYGAVRLGLRVREPVRRSRTGGRCGTRPCTSWSAGCGPAPGSSSPCTCCATPGPPTCCAQGSAWTWWPGCSPTARRRRPRRPTSTWTSRTCAPS